MYGTIKILGTNDILQLIKMYGEACGGSFHEIATVPSPPAPKILGQ